MRDLGPIPTELPVGPGTMSWTINREPAMLMGGGRALLLQVTHPSVAAGVEQHSNYKTDPWSRLFATLDIVFRIMFGTPAQSVEAAARLRRRHGVVNGTSADGTPYDALDPTLLLWVWATLTDTSLVIYERCFGPLSPGHRDRFVDEQALLAYACGVPSGECPASYRDFTDYVAHVVDSTLHATTVAVDVAEQLRLPPLPRPLRSLAGGPLGLVTAGTLPPRLREPLGFTWSTRHERALNAFFAATKAQRVVPRSVRELPSTLAARREKPLRTPKWLATRT
jgi:uncharacterized protein (DUF2236 family)